MPHANIRELKAVLDKSYLPYAVLKGYSNLVIPLEATDQGNIGVSLFGPDGQIWNSVPGEVKLVDNNNIAFGVERTNNRQRVSSIPYYYEIADGNIPTHARFTATGLNSAVPASYENIWDQGGVYTYLSAAAVMYISSSNAGDNQVWAVTGLDGNYNEQTVTVTANGQNQVQVGTGETFLRVFSVTNRGTTDNAGDIYIAESDVLAGGVPTTVSKIKAKALAGFNTSFSGMYTVPAGHVAYLVDGYVSSSSGKESTMFFRYRLEGGVFIYSRPVALNSSSLVFVSSIPSLIPAKTDIDFFGKTLTGGGNIQMGVIGWIEDQSSD